VDSRGCVGLFSSAGYGPVPEAVIEHATELDACSDTWRDAVPLCGQCIDRPRRPGLFTDWISAAERGLYGYDWKIHHGPYERLTVPSHPLHANDLPMSLRHLATIVALPLTFATAATVQAA